jgi:alkylated DNA repair dioxygenase AlkB
MQLSLLDQLAPAPDAGFGTLRRTDLGRGAWLDHAPDWLSGHNQILREMIDTCDFQTHRRQMYDRVVEVPRLIAGRPGSSEAFRFDQSEVSVVPSRASKKRVLAAAERLDALSALLSHRYGRTLSSITVGYYRDGRDSVAYHGDKLGVLRSDTIVAIVSVGARRRFLLRPVGGKTSHTFHFGGGDLLVMGGTCQQAFEHAVPKVAQVGPRMAIMFRERLPEPRAASASASASSPSRSGLLEGRRPRVA